MSKRGRPAKGCEPGPRVPLSLRVTPEAKRRLDAAATLSGRSQSQEAEIRIEQTFWLEELIKARLIKIRVPAGSRS